MQHYAGAGREGSIGASKKGLFFLFQLADFLGS